MRWVLEIVKFFSLKDLLSFKRIFDFCITLSERFRSFILLSEIISDRKILSVFRVFKIDIFPHFLVLRVMFTKGWSWHVTRFVPIPNISILCPDWLNSLIDFSFMSFDALIFIFDIFFIPYSWEIASNNFLDFLIYSQILREFC